MINSNNRYKPSQDYTIGKFNRKVNRMKSVNKVTNKRGGIKL